MEIFKNNIPKDSTLKKISESCLNELLKKYEWFTTARVIRSHIKNSSDPRLKIIEPSRCVSLFFLNDLDIEALVDKKALSDTKASTEIEVSTETFIDTETSTETEVSTETFIDTETSTEIEVSTETFIDTKASTETTPNDVIDNFLNLTNLRIVIDENKPELEIITEAIFTDEDDLVTEELANVYRDQGLYGDAKAIYYKLSLQNPEKSVYFARLIEDIENK